MHVHTKKSMVSLPSNLLLNLVPLNQVALNENKVIELSYQNYVLQVLRFIQ